MRQKLYYTVDEITNNLYTSGSLWMTESHIEYIGEYHTYITGEVYTDATWNSKTSKKLIKYTVENSALTTYKKLKTINVKYNMPHSSVIQITPADVKSGYVRRYFIKKLNETTITEIDSIEYGKYSSGQFDPILYSAITLNWKISGDLYDNLDNGVFHRGVQTTNQLMVAAAEVKMPGMLTKLTNYTEYYMSTDIYVPRDINS